MTLQVGITGGIGSGKSVVARIFSLLGVPIYDADTAAKKLMSTEEGLIAEIKKAFGKEAYHENGILNRAYLSQHVFNNSEKTNLLNSLVHPKVGIHYQKWAQQHAEHLYVIKEAALIFESGSYEQLDKVITVFAPKQLRIVRTLKRDTHRTEEQVAAIMNKQWDDAIKMERADYVIYNDDSQLVIPQVLSLDKVFRKASKH